MKTVQRLVLSILAALASALVGTPAFAQVSVECRSHNYQYTECQAPLSTPQLIHQISSSSCIVNRTWGFNRTTSRIWVAEGCSGVFADPQGYHYGRGDAYDPNARHYDERGHDAGKLTAGLIAAVILGAALEADEAKQNRRYTTSNDWYSHPGHVHRSKKNAGAPIDTRPAFDKAGNPNYDPKGAYIGCHGVGCLVDNPDTK